MCYACQPSEQESYCFDCETSFSECAERKKKIRDLNDSVRRGICNPNNDCKIILTLGVHNLPIPKVTVPVLLAGVANFDDFNEDNDPHNEHDFGSIVFCGETFFWKIDYYDNDLEFLSPDPSDPSLTARVLTVMRADEY